MIYWKARKRVSVKNYFWLNGLGKDFGINGKLVYEGGYRLGRRCGHNCKIYDEVTSNLVYYGEIKDDKKEGSGVLYFAEDNIDSFIVTAGKIHEKALSVSVKSKDIGEPRENGKNFSYKGNFRNDKIHSNPARIYYRSGVVKFCGKILEGNREGFGAGFHDTGMLRFEANFSNNLMNGNFEFCSNQ